jgi:drug/metabolite transporter (DMT)-like permease
LEILAMAGAVPALALGMLILHALNPVRFSHLLVEDGPVEVATALLFALAAFFAARIFFRRRGGPGAWFFAALAALGLLAAAEEISWGQRLLGFRAPDFIRHRNTQRETNMHNMLPAPLKPRHLECAAVLAGGVVLPVLAGTVPRIRRRMEGLGMKAPPLFLAPSFALACVFLLDWPTGLAEELGEFAAALGMAIFILREHDLMTERPSPHATASGPPESA